MTTIHAALAGSPLILTGPGRPDMPTTITDTAVAARVTSAPIGSMFTSTDGASVGAWQWMRTTKGWLVSYGDTGWYDLTPVFNAQHSEWEPTFKIYVRRLPQQVMLHMVASQATVISGIFFTLPQGFGIASDSGSIAGITGTSNPGIRWDRYGYTMQVWYLASRQHVRGTSTFAAYTPAQADVWPTTITMAKATALGA